MVIREGTDVKVTKVVPQCAECLQQRPEISDKPRALFILFLFCPCFHRLAILVQTISLDGKDLRLVSK